MKRKDFFNNLCSYGICSCTGMTLISIREAKAQDNGSSTDTDCERKKNFTNRRFNWLLQIMEQELDETEYKRIIRTLGKRCAQSIGNIATENKGNPEGYFKTVNEMWGEVFKYDRENQIVHLNTNLEKCF